MVPLASERLAVYTGLANLMEHSGDGEGASNTRMGRAPIALSPRSATGSRSAGS
jgi:hypothetical protein